LAVAADGKGFDRRDPRLLDGVAAELVGRRVVGKREPAIDLVDGDTKRTGCGRDRGA